MTVRHWAAKIWRALTTKADPMKGIAEEHSEGAMLVYLEKSL